MVSPSEVGTRAWSVWRLGYWLRVKLTHYLAALVQGANPVIHIHSERVPKGPSRNPPPGDFARGLLFLGPLLMILFRKTVPAVVVPFRC
jgi:hypothetical protein